MTSTEQQAEQLDNLQANPSPFASSKVFEQGRCVGIDHGLGSNDGESAASASLVFGAFGAALDARDLDFESLTVEGEMAFELASYRIADVLSSDLETTDDVDEQFGEDIDLTIVDDFATLNGTPLEGAAILGTDEIILDSKLEGEELRDALAEEIAETAFQQVYDTTSIGDFGAEVVARLQDTSDEAELQTYLTIEESDTVQTEYGTAEAYDDSAYEFFITILEQEAPNLEVTGYIVSDEETMREVADSVVGPEANSRRSYWGDEGSNTIGDIAVVDLDGDGEVWESALVFIDAGVPFDETSANVVSRASGYDYIPISGLTETYTASGSPGESRITTTYTSSAEYSLSEETNWSEANTVNGSANVTIGAFEVSGGVSETSSEGGSVTTSNTATATVTNSITEVLNGDDYPADTRLTVGLHETIADVNATTEYDMWFEFREADGSLDGVVRFDVEETRILEDYLLDITFTQHEVDRLELDETTIASLDSSTGLTFADLGLGNPSSSSNTTDFVVA
ncbi:hypothetical protein [Tateyamaria sp. syn59]|uniref:hypothetical protein n=1 Tax=Tateyamaria sp. syn59 TaxID=2576942 RepID=UPI0011BD62E0|nr:hypothetical protein [Tateyamaria sp. syn59]